MSLVPDASLTQLHYSLSAANKIGLPILGDMDLHFTVDGRKFVDNVSVSPAIDEFLLGSEWLVKNEAISGTLPQAPLAWAIWLQLWCQCSTLSCASRAREGPSRSRWLQCPLDHANVPAHGHFGEPANPGHS